MIEKFKQCLERGEYLSNYVYLFIKENYFDMIPEHFDIDKYNEQVLEKEYLKYKDYFQNIYKGIDDNIVLDKEQIEAILADEVIVIDLNQYFPKEDDVDFWVKEVFMNRREEEEIPFAEERRVFYVALTRTKNHVYLLTNTDNRKNSCFLKELYDIMKKSIAEK